MPIPSFRLLDDEAARWPEIGTLGGRILRQARHVYRELGHGMYDPIHKDAMMIALAEEGVRAERDVPVHGARSSSTSSSRSKWQWT